MVRLGGSMQLAAYESDAHNAPTSVPGDRVIELLPWANPETLARALDRMIESKPDEPERFYVRGLIRLSLGQRSLADEDFIEALRLGHRDPKLIDRLVEDDAIFEDALEQLQLQSWSDHEPAAVILRIHRAARLARQHQWRAAADVFGDAAESSPNDQGLRRYQMLALLAAGEFEAFDGIREAVQKPILALGDPDAPDTIGPGRSGRASLAALAPGARETSIVSRPAPDRLLDEISGRNGHPFDQSLTSRGHASGFRLELRRDQTLIERHPGISRADGLKILGALLYRAGQFDEAKSALEEKIRLSSGESTPQDWAFLSLTLHRLGRRSEALQWLGRFRGLARVTTPWRSGTSWRSAYCKARPKP